MPHYHSIIILFLLLFTTSSCGNSSGQQTTLSDTADIDSPISAIDSLDIPELIAWKAGQGMPLYSEDIDTIVAYFAKADRWTGENLVNIHTPQQFDSIEALYIKTFPYIEMYSSILEQYADFISEEQMNRLQATAISLGEKVDRAAKAAGMDPESIKASVASQQPDLSETKPL